MKTALTLLLLAPMLAFGQTSFTGSLDPADANSVLLITFHVAAPTTITAQSWGAGGSAGAPGGVNAQGTAIPAGGFDPYFSLFAGTTAAATLVATNDDGVCPPATPVSAVCLDPVLTRALPAGDYTLAVTVFENFSFAENLGAGTLGDGFIGLGNYYSTVTNSVLTANYAVDLSGAVTITGVTPVGGGDPVPPAARITKVFSPAAVPFGGTSTLALGIVNLTSAPLTGVSLSDTYPVGMVGILGGPAPSGCGVPLVSATTAGWSISNATVAPGFPCVLNFTVQGNVAGMLTNVTGPGTYTGPNGPVAFGFGSAILTVAPPAPPTVTKSFSGPTVGLGATTTMTLALSNPNGAALTNVQIADTMPAGLALVGFAPASITAACGVPLTTQSATTLTASLPTLAGGATCTLTFTVKGTALGVTTNTTGAPTGHILTQTLTGLAASARIEVVVLPPVISKSFTPSTIQVGGATVLTITVANPNALVMTNVNFTDVMPGANLIIPSPGDIASAGCGATAAGAVGSNLVSLSNGTLAAGATCTITVTVQGIAPGVNGVPVVNTTTTVTGTVATVALVGPPATANLQIGPSQLSFLVRYAANLVAGDSVVNLTNLGSFSSLQGIPNPQNGNICANVYTYSPDEQLVSCCSCLVTPNALNSLSVINDLTTNTLTPIRPSAAVIKMVASAPSTSGACNPATVTRNGAANFLVPGLEAWGSTLHPLPVTAGSPAGTFGTTETSFLRGTYSDAELSRMTQLCAFIQANGSGYGICKSCKVGGQGASAK